MHGTHNKLTIHRSEKTVLGIYTVHCTGTILIPDFFLFICQCMTRTRLPPCVGVASRQTRRTAARAWPWATPPPPPGAGGGNTSSSSTEENNKYHHTPSTSATTPHKRDRLVGLLLTYKFVNPDIPRDPYKNLGYGILDLF